MHHQRQETLTKRCPPSRYYHEKHNDDDSNRDRIEFEIPTAPSADAQTVIGELPPSTFRQESEPSSASQISQSLPSFISNASSTTGVPKIPSISNTHHYLDYYN